MLLLCPTFPLAAIVVVVVVTAKVAFKENKIYQKNKLININLNKDESSIGAAYKMNEGKKGLIDR